MTKNEPMMASEASPYKSTAEELAALRKMFRLVCRYYMERLEMEIVRVHEQVVTAGIAASQGDHKKTGVPAGKRSAKAAKAGSGRGAGGSSATLAVQAAHNGFNSQIHDLRDMLTLLRTLNVKPEAGRRKDLKKIESLVEDLRLLSERWG